MESPVIAESATRELNGYVALVTGGSRGIGAAICRELAAGGAAVAVNYRTNQAMAEEVVAGIRATDGKAIALHGDVANFGDAKNIVDQTITEFGRMDILVNNAGIAKSTLIRDADPEAWEQVMKVNFGGVFNCTKAVMEHFVRQRSGTIVNISSVMADRGWVGESGYAASKGAVSAFTRCCALEAAPFGIRVNAVLPGFTATDLIGPYLESHSAKKILGQIPARRFADPQQIGAVVRFLAGSNAEYVNGSLLEVDGGMTAALARGRPGS
jgi:3-oxoacyl-[acyl-carrier protein] reductase